MKKNVSIRVPSNLYTENLTGKATLLHCTLTAPHDQSQCIQAERSLVLVGLPLLRTYRLIEAFNIPVDDPDHPSNFTVNAGETCRFTLIFEGLDDTVQEFFVYEPGIRKGFQTGFISRNQTDAYDVRLHTLRLA